MMHRKLLKYNQLHCGIDSFPATTLHCVIYLTWPQINFNLGQGFLQICFMALEELVAAIAF